MDKEKKYYEQLGYDFDPPFYRAEDKPVVTNADKIRAMTDEELAIWISHISACTWCPAKNIETANPCKGLYSGCKGNWLDWMKQEVEQ